MLYPYNLEFYTKKDYRNSQKQLVQGEMTYSFSSKCDIQPYSKELAEKDYGITVKCNRMIFMPVRNDIEIDNTYAKYNNKFYKVVGIPWDIHHLELLLDEC